MIQLAVTGTDTGVGKTVVACALAAACAQRGLQVGVLKPVETGVEPGTDATDADRLAAAAGTADPADVVAPYRFAAPLAPMVAARREAATVELSRLDSAFEVVSAGRDVVIVEGAGGLLVPITPELAFDSLFARWRLGVVVVAPDRLGVINQVRLTVLGAGRARLVVKAIVLNAVDPALRDASTGANLPVLTELLPSIPVVEFPRLGDVRDNRALTATAERAGLLDASGITGTTKGAVTPGKEW